MSASPAISAPRQAKPECLPDQLFWSAQGAWPSAASVRAACERLGAAGVRVALFIDPEPDQIDAAAECGAPVIELHTGEYADATGAHQAQELERLRRAARHAAQRRLEVHAGHGLNYRNVDPVAAIPDINELNIGHAIIAESLFSGLAAAVRAMRTQMQQARR